MSRILQIVSAIEGYDPDALHVEKARAAIRACLAPVTELERLPVREGLGRVLAEDIVPAIDVPEEVVEIGRASCRERVYRSV